MYAKVFEEIFDSSIADDYELRHFFMDLLVLADCNGIVDKTATAISARTRIPLKKVEAMLKQLQQPDPQSRNPEHSGRRLELLDEHRNWGWYIVNYQRYREIASASESRATSKVRMENHRTKVKNAQLLENQAGNGSLSASQSPSAFAFASAGDGNGTGNRDGNGAGKSKFEKPSVELVKQHGLKIGLPVVECEKFHDYYEANGWRVGKNPMKLWTAALANWKRHWQEYKPQTKLQPPPRVGFGNL